MSEQPTPREVMDRAALLLDDLELDPFAVELECTRDAEGFVVETTGRLVITPEALGAILAFVAEVSE